MIPRSGPSDPQSVLFLCGLNTIRSPMAAALLMHRCGRRIHVQSAGVREGAEVDGFAVAVMGELGLDIAGHRPQCFTDLDDRSFELIVSLSPEAHHQALELIRMEAVAVEYWPIPDPTVIEGSRERRLEAYRAVRDALMTRIRARFPAPLIPQQ